MVVTSCAVTRARRAPVLLLQRAAPIDVVGAGRRRRSRSRRPRLRPSPSPSSKSSNRPHLTSAAAPVVAVVAATPVSVAGPKSTLARPTSAKFSARRSADAPTAIVSAIDIDPPGCAQRGRRLFWIGTRGYLTPPHSSVSDHPSTELLCWVSSPWLCVHYTTNYARAMQCSGRWRLSVGYRQCPDHNQSKTMRADSHAKKFRMPDLPTLFDSEEDALAMGVEFREHVENVVQGNRPRIMMAVSAPQPPKFENARRAACLIQRRVRSQREQRQLEARLKRDMRRRTI